MGTHLRTQRVNSGHREWLNNEYSQWVKALQESTVDNFGSHPMVKRMLGEVNVRLFWDLYDYIPPNQMDIINVIHPIGGNFGDIIHRMVYYAQKVLKENPTSIVEIGGGVGQFYAVLRALGYKGKYFIYDLPEVKEFQRKYLDRVTELTGLNTDLKFTDFDYCVSFYCLGELDDETKSWYVENVVKKCPHGMMVFNPHSGASSEIPFPCKVEDEYPLTNPGNKQLTW